ncbi:hypothetical protein HI806_18160 [Ralstonia solanacearum]|uniref:hypothetical protein n=1 Tax=Ralstonia pseudosolanacearum TaxID=1310165 RepID=UPI0002F904CC|nr:hypothetical protein [Ralstonia pseudosolanacearum]AOE91497.1 hypothetical protein LBM341_03244 [Ralstonia solanacearum]APF88466.1 hypothetical protein BCR16_17575 [Ralstonia solanacearum FJAT-1458]ARS57813.1 hypothetical protein BC427_00735 [Ralstonia solanacearum FJAT-91]ESS47987.1 hypothetical protein L665_03960 [Ralstonia solanacearum SD54]AXW58670.1 hypothetical protein CJO93_15645 [Ralstonia solanacearum]
MKTRFDGGYLIFLLGIITLTTTVYAVWTHFSPVPYADQWDGTIGFYLRALQNPWQAFFELHNEHRLIFSRLFFYADIRYFGGRNVLLLVANVVLAGLLAAVFFRVVIRNGAPQDRETRIGLAGLILVFVFSWVQGANFAWGFQNQWFAVNLFSLLAFHYLELAGDAYRRGSSPESNALLAKALLSGSVAALSMASGLLVLPILVVQALYLRFSRRTVWLLVTTTAATWIAYFFDWKGLSGNAHLLTALREHPAEALQYVLLYLGAPAYLLSRSEPIAYAGGATVLLTFACLVLKALRSRAPAPAISLLAFALFAISNAVTTASGRLSIGVEHALQSRYTTASLAAWLALILFATLNFDSQKGRNSVLVTAVIVSLFVASGQRFTSVNSNHAAFSRRFAGLALRSHVYDLDITGAVYPLPEPLSIISQAAEQANVSIFAPDQPDYFVPPSHVTATSICDGHIDKIAATTTPGMYRAEGWIFDAGEKRVPRDVVVTDADGATLGTGVTGKEYYGALEIKDPNALYRGWSALFKAPTLITPLIVAPTSQGTYCKLQETGTAYNVDKTSAP